MNVPVQLRSRKIVYRWAWILFWVSILIPAPGFLYSGFWGRVSGLSVIGYVIEWGRGLPDVIDARLGIRVFLLTLSLLSNLVFAATRVIGEKEVTSAWRLLIIGSLTANASLIVFFPIFMKIPGFWFWLAAWGAVAWAFLEIPGTEHVAAEGDASGVPVLLWVWLAFLVFWMGVTAANQIAPPVQQLVAAPEPSALTGYFNDPDHLFEPGEKERVDGLLSAFEKATSCQLAVAVYSRVPAGSVEDFTVRTAELSRLGRKGLDNGAVLFTFARERVARLEVGYGLEERLPDITAFHILEQELVPRFAKGDYEAGIDASLTAVLAAVGDGVGKTKSPGLLSVAWRQLASAARRVRREAWPELRQTDVGARVGISFFAGLLGLGVSEGIRNLALLLRALVVGVWNLARRRPFGTAIRKVDVEPIWDTVKLVAILAILIGGVVVVAGGGGFGGAGALVRW